MVGGELGQDIRLNEELIKDISGGDMLQGRQLYGEASDFRPTAKLWLYGNHLPEIRSIDNGTWRRLLVVPFTATFKGEDRDTHLSSKLREELPGIFMWAYLGLMRWSEEGLNPPPILLEQVRAYRSEQDLLGRFLQENTEERPGSGEDCRVKHTFKALRKDGIFSEISEGEGSPLARKNATRIRAAPPRSCVGRPRRAFNQMLADTGEPQTALAALLMGKHLISRLQFASHEICLRKVSRLSLSCCSRR